MNVGKISFIIISFLLLVGGVGCEKEKEEQVPTKLYGAWKLIGFGNTADNTLREAEPKDCEECYTITFMKNGAVTGYATTNEIAGVYEIKNNFLHFPFLGLKTGNNELWDGKKFLETAQQVYRFEIKSKQLFLFYSDTKYLMFKKHIL